MKRRSKSSLFLIELIIVILFFSLASTVCVQLFVKSHLLDKKTKHTNLGVKVCQNYAEIFSGVNGDAEAFYDIVANDIHARTANGCIICYSEKGVVVHSDSTEERQSTFECRISFTEVDRIVTATISFLSTGDDEEIYSLTVKKYVGGATHE